MTHMLLVVRIWLIESILNLKSGTCETFCKFRLEVKGIWPILVTGLEVPSGKVTKMGLRGLVCYVKKA